ncbi:unnamed protein product [Vitrella brassicaformis CCMP3155]|uniref:Lon N-terminal domain-containing protein n=2 Tax=Vitrella brassicaformis TaxID=1169539 RepID=A0A0G4FFW0_VITBC|nr:unnamed protein product [Vitrella brassicaformis CCMP3155]|eukprot:CEM12073.1 unnamed protein product [Vitrella brassicaformis CCMP3155]
MWPLAVLSLFQLLEFCGSFSHRQTLFVPGATLRDLGSSRRGARHRLRLRPSRLVLSAAGGLENESESDQGSGNEDAQPSGEASGEGRQDGKGDAGAAGAKAGPAKEESLADQLENPQIEWYDPENPPTLSFDVFSTGKARELPLFPLETIVFPYQNQTLLLFEPRYIKLLKDITRQPRAKQFSSEGGSSFDSSTGENEDEEALQKPGDFCFGMLLPEKVAPGQAGQEPRAQRYSRIGTIIRVEDFNLLRPDGSLYHIRGQGIQRFKLLKIMRDSDRYSKDYMSGLVEPIEDNPTNDTHTLVSLEDDVWDIVSSIINIDTDTFNLNHTQNLRPEERRKQLPQPRTWEHLVRTSFDLSELLTGLSVRHKQYLLQTTDTAERLRYIYRLLDRARAYRLAKAAIMNALKEEEGGGDSSEIPKGSGSMGDGGSQNIPRWS